MANAAIPAPQENRLPIAGSDQRFPVGRIFCVGRNFAAHALEMGHDPDREAPFFFSKHGSCATESGQTVPFPTQTKNLHHEAELVVAIGKQAAGLSANQARDHIWGYASGNDLTRRDLQAEAKEKRRPWDMAKSFDNAAIIGALHPVSDVGHPTKERITATVDTILKQDGNLAQMIWPATDLVAYLSHYVTLLPGDLIMTGTPDGVGPIAPGQHCRVEIDGLSPAEVTFAARN